MTRVAPWRRWRADLLGRLGLGRAMPGGESSLRELGLRGERAAASFLKRRRFRIIQRSVRVAIGEADLVCLGPDRATIVIVEVKARVLPADGSAPTYAPEDSVTVEKRRKLLAVARWLVRANGWENRAVRIDAVAVEFPPAGNTAPRVRHHERIAIVQGA